MYRITKEDIRLQWWLRTNCTAFGENLLWKMMLILRRHGKEYLRIKVLKSFSCQDEFWFFIDSDSYGTSVQEDKTENYSTLHAMDGNYLIQGVSSYIPRDIRSKTLEEAMSSMKIINQQDEQKF